MKDANKDFFQLAYAGRRDWWLFLVTPLLVFVGYFLGQLPMVGVQLFQMSKNPSLGMESMLEFEKTMDWSIFGIDKNLGLLLMILMFVFATGGLWLGLRIHKRTFKDIITPYNKIRWNKILFGFGVWALLGIAFELVNYGINPDQYEFRAPGLSYIFLLLVAFLFLPIQTSLEEFLFRGYAMPGISLLTKEKIAPLVITSILFSLVHSMNPEIEKFGFWAMQPYYIGAGLLLGIITIMDDGLELSLGVHAGTNILGVVLFTYEGSVLQTDALLSVQEVNPTLMTIGFYITAILFYIICHYRFKWRPLSYLLEPLKDEGINRHIALENDTVIDDISSDTEYEDLI